MAWLTWPVAIAGTLLSCAWYWHVQGYRRLVPNEGIYSYVGWAWAHGDQLYRDAWDHKGPVVYGLTAVRTWLFGTDAAWIGAQEILLGLLAATALAWAAARTWGGRTGALALFLTTVLWMHLGPDGDHVSTTGSIIALLSCLVVALSAEIARTPGARRLTVLACAAGIAEGLLFLAKPNAIVTVPLLGLAFLARGAPPRALGRAAATVVLGALVPLALFAGGFARHGTLDDAVEAVFTFNAIRGPAVFDLFGYRGLALSTVQHLSTTNVFAIVLATGLTSLWLLVQRRSRTLSFARWGAPLWVVLELVGFLSNGGILHHLFTLLFAAAFAATWLVVEIHRIIPSSASRLVESTVLTLVLTPVLVTFARLDPKTTRPVSDVVAQYLAATTAPNERILHFPGWTSASVLVAAQRKAAMRYMTPLALALPGYASDERWSEFTRHLERPNPVRTVLADVIGEPRWASRDSLPQMVQHLDYANSPVVPARVRFPARERAKRLLIEHYVVEWCHQWVCVLRRREAGEVARSWRGSASLLPVIGSASLLPVIGSASLLPVISPPSPHPSPGTAPRPSSTSAPGPP